MYINVHEYNAVVVLVFLLILLSFVPFQSYTQNWLPGENKGKINIFCKILMYCLCNVHFLYYIYVKVNYMWFL